MSRGKTNLKIITIFLGILLTIFVFIPLNAQAVVENSGDIIKSDTNLSAPESLLLTGAAIYRVPIEVPPGRLGMAPNLELVYSSYQKNGWIGVGWSIDMGSIQRNTKHGLNYGNNDFVFVKNGSMTELINVGSNDYMTKIEDGSFLKFNFDGTYWTVYDKDGKVYKYGSNTDDSSKQKSYDPKTNNYLGVFKWGLDRVEDSNGNYMTINYKPDQPNQGEIYLWQIKYTGNSSLDTSNTIEFRRESRTDIPVSYFTHSAITIATRLKTIMITENGVNVRKYELWYDVNPTTHYSSSTGRSLLSKIEKYGYDTEHPDGIKWPQDTIFTWNQIALDELGKPIYSLVDKIYPNAYTKALSAYNKPQMADFDGDGKADIIYEDSNQNFHVLFRKGDDFIERDHNNGCFTREYKYNKMYPGYKLGDVNGDGKTDVIYEDINNNFHVLISKGDEDVCFMNDNPNGWVHQLGDYDYPVQMDGWNVGDFNGDGKTDITYTSLSPIYWKSHILLSLGTSFTPDTLEGCHAYIYGYGCDVIIDANNDGKMDNIGSCSLFFDYYANGFSFGTHVSLITANTESCLSNFSISLWGEQAYKINANRPSIRPADVNGDGLPDIIYESKESEEHEIRVFLNYGSGFINDNKWGTRDITLNPYSGGAQIIDFDGDGLADFVFEHHKDTYVMKSLGHLNSDSKGFLDIRVGKPWGTRMKGYYDFNIGLRAADINGDGLFDLYYEDGTKTIHGLENQSPYPDLINTIKDFKGTTYAITYKPSTSYQNKLMPFIVQTVSSITISDMISGTSMTTSYEYSGGYYDYPSREFRGFGYVKQINPDNTTLETWFHQKNDKDAAGNYSDDEDFKGKPYLKILKDSTGALISREEWTWDRDISKDSDDPYPVFAKLINKKTDSYFGGVGVTKNEAYIYDDANGNLLSTIISGTGAEDVTTINTYWQSPNKWLWMLESTTITGSSTGQSRKTLFEYYSNGTGNLWKKKYWLKDVSENEYPTEIITYTAEGNIDTVQDAKLNLTKLYYDDAQKTFPNRIEYPQTNGINHNVRHEYDYRYGTVSCSWDENNNKTCSTPDAFGRIKETISYEGEGPTIAAKITKLYVDYREDGNPIYIKTSVLEDNKSSEVYIDKYDFFDKLGRNIQTITFGQDSKEIVTQTHYDKMGRVDLTKGPFFSNSTSKDFLRTEYDEAFPCTTTYPCTQTTYYEFGKPYTITSTDTNAAGENTTITSTIDYRGLSTKVTDPDNKSMQETRDYLGRTILVTEYADAGEQDTFYEYNAAGDLQTVIDHFYNMTFITTDELGRKKKMQDPDMGIWQYCYDKNGNLKKQIDADGNIINFDYDTLNRIWQKTYFKTNDPSSITDPCSATGVASDNTITYTYDIAAQNGKGNLYQASNTNVTTTYDAYDTMGRATSEIKTIAGDTTAYTTGYEYDRSGKPTKITYPTGSPLGSVQYDYYQGTGLLFQVTGSDNVTYATNTLYTPLGSVGKIDYPYNISTTYSYDPKSTRLTGIVATNGTPPDIINRVYRYTGAGDIQTITDSKKGTALGYSYDSLHRLTGETNTNNAYSPLGFSYNEIGNIMKKTAGTATYDYVYDNNKIHTLNNLIVNGQAYNLGYNQREVIYNADLMPREVKKDGNTAITLMYDAFDERAKKTSPAGDTYYIGGHLEKINGELTAYVFAGDLRIAKVTATKKYFYLKDHLGSTLAITDSGNVVETMNYTPYGELREHQLFTGASVTNYLFTDQEYDPETGLYNYVARLYDPVIGRFISADSIVPDPYDPQSLNRYSYVLNNPLIYTDPTGNFELELNNYAGGFQSYSSGSWGSSWTWGGMNFTFNAESAPGSFTTGYGPFGQVNLQSGNKFVDYTILGVANIAFNSANSVANYCTTNAATQFMGSDAMVGHAASFPTFYDDAIIGGFAALNRFSKIETTATRGVGNVFWAGGDKAEQAAIKFAQKNGGKTLGMTAKGQELRAAEKGMDWYTQARPLWVQLSKEFSAEATGTVHVFHNAKIISLESIWRIEYSILKKNNVKIIYHMVP